MLPVDGLKDCAKVLSAIRRTMLGVGSRTCAALVDAELGVPSQRVMSVQQILRFYDVVRGSRGVPKLVASLMGYLKTDRSSGTSSKKYDVRNGWKVMARLAADVGWAGAVRGRSGRRKQLRAVGQALRGQEVRTAAGGGGSSAQRWLGRWPVVGQGMADYLGRRCLVGLREGRRFKTRLRLGAWRLWMSEDRTCCPCCGVVGNSAEHAVFQCALVASEKRQEFVTAMDRLVPGFAGWSCERQLEFVLRSDLPKGFDGVLYGFFSVLATERARLRDDGVSQSVVSRSSVSGSCCVSVCRVSAVPAECEGEGRCPDAARVVLLD